MDSAPVYDLEVSELAIVFSFLLTYGNSRFVSLVTDIL